MMRTTVALTIRQKVSWKSKLGYCEKPLATSLALYRAIVPSDILFILNNHLQPIGIIPPGREGRHHVFLTNKAFNSSLTTLAQCQDCTAQ